MIYGEIRRIVMQPTSLCNLNCSYCYLAHRQENKRMSVSVSDAVANSVGDTAGNIRITWHGGEPLSCGSVYFKELLLPFESLRVSGKVSHSIQTNGTLINDEWCLLFKKYNIQVGVSLDGPKWANHKRVSWNNRESYANVIKGINFLKKHEVPFSVICVVGEHSLNQAGELYDFFTKLGCYEVGFNFEEKIGINNTIPSDSQYKVKKFWEELFVAWKKNPVIEVREFSDILNWMSIISEEAINKPTPGFLDLFPSVSYSGDVVLLSPEFLDAKSEYYNNFVVGNVLSKSLISILFDGEKAKYVSDFNKGLEKCLQLCEYSEHCMGGQASSKFFELGSTNGTETTYCRNSEQFLIEAVLTVI